MPAPPTPAQAHVLGLIWEGLCRDGYQPTIRELALARGVSGNHGIHQHLNRLADKGWIALPEGPQRSRAVRLLFAPDGRPFRGLAPRGLAVNEQVVIVIASPSELRRDADLIDGGEETPRGTRLAAGAAEMREIASRLEREAEFSVVRPATRVTYVRGPQQPQDPTP